MPLRADQLQASLAKSLQPVYLVAGEELLLVNEAVDAIRKRARESGYTERDVLTVEKGFDWNRLHQAGESQSLFAEKKIIELRMPTGKPGREGSTAVQDFLASSSDHLLLISCNQWSANQGKAKWVQVIEKAGHYVPVWPVKPHELPAWIRQRMEVRGLKPEPEAVALLAMRLEGNLMAAQQEIDKLWLIAGNGRVTEDNVREWVADSARFGVFRLLDSLLSGRTSETLRIAAGLKSADEKLYMLTGALVNELNVLEQLVDARDSGRSVGALMQSLRIFRTRQSLLEGAVNRLRVEDLKRAIGLAAAMDRQTKGRMAGDPWMSLNALVGCFSRSKVVALA